MSTSNLNTIATRLEGLEETIIHKLIDRAQFLQNQDAYAMGKSGFADAGDLPETALPEPTGGSCGPSLFQIRLVYQERMDAEFGRFVVPEERPFTPALPSPKRMVHTDTSQFAGIDLSRVSVTKELLGGYLQFLPQLCGAGDDGQYGSAVEHDVMALQAVSRRVHFGALYVGDTKFRADTEGFCSLVENGDRQAIEEKLTRPEVEERILARVAEKVAHIQSRINVLVRRKVDPELFMAFYGDLVIPLTKEGEIRYIEERVCSTT